MRRLARARQAVAGTALSRAAAVAARLGRRAATVLSARCSAETGLLNAAGDLGFAFGGFASLEAIVKLKPDFIVVSQAGDRAEDDGQAFLLHPALERFYPPEKRIVIPERHDRMRRRDAGGCAGRADGGVEAGGAVNLVVASAGISAACPRIS